VQLKHTPTGIVVKCQETRSQHQNREIARRLLADKVEHAQNGQDSRVAIKSREAARKKASKLKKSRRKYRKLEEEKLVKESPTQPETTNQNSVSDASDSR
jgi:peptide chain release factor